jgi:phosphoacetylglucosamine mutase
MYYKYGTSGFRYDSKIILSISLKIGEAISYIANKSKNFGIMITASHNYHLDNGVKIVNEFGEMLNQDQEIFIEKYINNMIPLKHISIDLSSKSNIFIGMDTRKDCSLIFDKISNGIKNSNPNINIINLGKVTTPQHHFLTKYNFNNPFKYIKFYNDAFNFWSPQKITIDCANGIGYKTFNELKKYYNLKNINFKNIKINDYEKLNYLSGSDYVYSNNKLPFDNTGGLMASLDGDADRFILYFMDQKLNILDGDYISALYTLCSLKCLIKLKNKYTFGVIHTSYTNNSFIKYIQKLSNDYNYDINLVCTPTGVKHLHHEAIKYDISVYFETNGHGTILINNKELLKLKYFNMISKLNNDVVGDAISGILCTLFSFDYHSISYKDLFKFFTKNKFILYKKTVNDKNSYVTTKNQRRLIKPTNVQNKLDSIMNKYKCFIFIRPSGTENILRIYIEIYQNYDLDLIKSEFDHLLI